MSRKPSWSPNSTYLHLDFLCQHTKKKDKAGQFATGSPEHSNKNGEHQENQGKPSDTTKDASETTSGTSPLAHHLWRISKGPKEAGENASEKSWK